MANGVLLTPSYSDATLLLKTKQSSVSLGLTARLGDQGSLRSLAFRGQLHCLSYNILNYA